MKHPTFFLRFAISSRRSLSRRLCLSSAIVLPGILALCNGCNSAPESEATSEDFLDTPYEIAFQKVVQSASGKVFPSLVYIRVIQDNLEGGKTSAIAASGSGVLISPEGEIVTNWHVINKASSIRCQLNDGRAYDADLIGSDKDTDLALLKLKRPEGDVDALPCAQFNHHPVSEGDFVMAMGAPWGLSRSVSIGIISCANRFLPEDGEYSLWYQTDASISPGNSGGPLISIDGSIVGINTLGYLMGGTVGFTVPAATIEIVVPRLREYGKANWAWFGLQLQVLHDFDKNIYLPYDRGVMIAGTDPGSPARLAGLQSNDLLVAINGESVTAINGEDLPALKQKLGLFPFDEPVVFTVERNGKTETISVTPVEKGKVEGEELACPRWNFTVKAINRFDNQNLYFYRHEGVFIYGVTYPGNAAKAGLRQDDILESINGREINSLDDLQTAYDDAMANLSKTKRATLKILRNGTSINLILNYANNYDKE